MKTFVVFKKQPGELINAYSLVDSETLKNIPKKIILKTMEVEDRLYSKDEFEVMRKQLI